MGFGKIFDSTFTGSMVGTGPTVFAVWSYIIANARPPGLVELNPVILSAVIGTPVDDIERALNVLTGPDSRSRTKTHDGRRLIPAGEFLYEVPTWAKYRDARNDDERKAYNAEAQRKHRAKKKQSIRQSLTVNDNKHSSAQAEAEAVPPPSRFEEFWKAYPKKKSKGDAERAWRDMKCERLSNSHIMGKLEEAKLSNDWKKDNGQFIPYPASWLRSKGWEDVFSPVVNGSKRLMVDEV